ncbi:hypothetical protein KVT40_006759 [Elsinoe batatas]|uniref:Altered inheritance of mitochondria protein 9, mitochondrial n=1 Tax=Elsinoe batatas TaxID=2601811 RepID=A0A8K0KYN3_9PEZI|nr:hypothetical protein KVT40_006759 [Elsinoe batatas]
MALPLRSSRIVQSAARSMRTPWSASRALHGQPDELYSYTSGRWLWDEEQHLLARQRWFDIKALAAVAIDVKQASRCLSITKVADGEHSRVLRLIMDNRQSVVVRIPYLSQQDAASSISSEAAIMTFVADALKLPVPRPLLCEPSADNPVGCEYLMMEEASGTPLHDVWHLKNIIDRAAIAESLIEIQANLISTAFDSHGSLYVSSNDTHGTAPSPSPPEERSKDGYHVGPLADLDGFQAWTPERGPGPSAKDWLQAIAQNHINHLESTLLNRRALLKSTTSIENRIELYQKVFCVVQAITSSAEGDVSMIPRLWHSDKFDAKNIFVTGNKVTGVTGWRGSSVAPLPFLARQPDWIRYQGPYIYKLPPEFEAMTDREERDWWGYTVGCTLMRMRYKDDVESRCKILDRILHSPMSPLLGQLADLAIQNYGDTMGLRETIIQVTR